MMHDDLPFFNMLMFQFSNVGVTITNHPQVITIDSCYVYHSQSWVVYYCYTPITLNTPSTPLGPSRNFEGAGSVCR